MTSSYGYEGVFVAQYSALPITQCFQQQERQIYISHFVFHTVWDCMCSHNIFIILIYIYILIL